MSKIAKKSDYNFFLEKHDVQRELFFSNYSEYKPILRWQSKTAGFLVEESDFLWASYKSDSIFG